MATHSTTRAAAAVPWHAQGAARAAIVLLCLVGIGLLGTRYASQAVDLPDGIRACLEDPAAHDGTPVVMPVWFVSGVDGPERYRVSRVVKDVPVDGPTAGLERGAIVTLVGHFRAEDGVVVEERRELHTLRTHKKVLSLLGLGLGMLATPLVLRRRNGGLVPSDPTADSTASPVDEVDRA